jgi:iron(III) transport system substrate-binding protein
MKKRILVTLLAGVMCLGMSGCQSKPAVNQSDAANTAVVAETEPVSTDSSDKLIIYTSLKESMISELVKDFMAKNPDIQADYQSAGAGKLMAKIATERESGQIMADVIWTSEVPDFFSMKSEGILMQYKPNGAENVLNPLEGTDDYFIPARLGTLGIAYNTTFVKNAPTSWADLCGPDFKDAFAIANPSQSGTSYVSVVMLEKQFTDKIFKDLRSNGALVGQGSGQVVDDTASGEMYGCLAVDYITYDKVNSGATLAMAYPEEMLVIPSPIAIFKDTKKPDAAKKFVDYMISEDAQTIIAENGTLPVLASVKVPDKYNIPSAEDALKRGIKVDYQAMMVEKEAKVDAFLTIMQNK